jgi:hypothetical protein
MVSPIAPPQRTNPRVGEAIDASIDVLNVIVSDDEPSDDDVGVLVAAWRVLKFFLL